jgi:translation initiation factor IF-3
LSIQKSSKGFFRSNAEITASEVRLIDQDGSMIGIVPIFKALQIASDQGLDLVEVSPQAIPPVCKITNAGKLKYESRKQMQSARKNQKKVQLKEINLRPCIGENDLMIKVNNIIKFINEGNQVKISVKFRGREITHSEQGIELLDKIWIQVSEIAVKDSEPKLEGKQMIMRISPNKTSI